MPASTSTSTSTLGDGSTATAGFDSIESTIAAFRDGKFIVVLDDTSRENEGDLIIAAEDMTAEKMAFMVRHTSGIICTPLASELCQKLSLPQMVENNEDPNRTAYTISVDVSADGEDGDSKVTTGISAYDRASTCRKLASPKARPETFRRPGHVFPLKAKDGGIRQRQGHTEAAVEFCRLTGKNLAGVISEIVDDGEEPRDGTTERMNPGMMRRDACLEFGRRWGLRVCTIEDLVAYVEKTEGKLESVANGVNGTH